MLTFEAHISEKVNKANQIMGMIHRTFTTLNMSTFRCLFKVMVRPHLEFGQTAWSPYKKKDIRVVENVLRRASKLVPGLKTLSYSERLKQLNLPTMAYRRIRGDMIEVYKILTGKYDKEVNIQLQRHTGHTRGNKLKLSKARARTQLRQMFFTSRITNIWNSLPNDVIEAPSTATFERRLDKFWSNQEVKYDFEEDLVIAPSHHLHIEDSDSDNDLDIEA